MAWVSHKTILPVSILLVVAGCATVPLDDARRNFYCGQLVTADQTLSSLPENADRILNLMERGMIRHVRQDYTNSTADWLEAVRREKQLETHSISKAGASMLVNDSLLNFRGYPYEQTYLHVYLARNYLAQGLWEDAGVEARSIALKMEKLEEFPDDPYCHYLAGFCLELCGDDSNSAMQFRQTAKLSPALRIDRETGRFLPLSPSSNAPPRPGTVGTELVCFLDFDGYNGMMPEYAEIYAEGKLLGTSRTFVNTLSLETESRERMKVRRTVKSVGRLAVKGAAVLAASSRNNDLAPLLLMLLFATETEDTRRWETLPAKFAVARVLCPETLREFQVEFKSFSGSLVKRLTVTHPLVRKNRIYVSMCRDHP